MVAMFENFNPRGIPWPLKWHQQLVNRGCLNLYYHLRNIFDAEGSSRAAFFLQKLRVEMTRAKVLARVSLARAKRGLTGDASGAFHHIKVADVYEDALQRYDVKPYRGELTIFMTDRRLAGFGDRLGGWEDVAQGGVRCYSLPIGPKGSLMEPYVEQLAGLLRECLDRAAGQSQRHPSDPSLRPASVREVTSSGSS